MSNALKLSNYLEQFLVIFYKANNFIMKFDHINPKAPSNFT